MHGLVSLLPEPQHKQVEALWQELEDECGLRGIRITPYPHFSWTIAEGYDWPALEAALGELSAALPPLHVGTTGLGLFTGARPVIFIPVVKTAALLAYHERIWNGTLLAARGASQYYSPDHWVPHISLAYADVEPSNIGLIMERLAFRSYEWDMEIDNLSLVYEPAGEVGSLRYRFDLAR